MQVTRETSVTKPKIKGQTKLQKKKLNKIEISNLTDAGFKILVIRMPTYLSENVNNEIGNIKMEIENIK